MIYTWTHFFFPFNSLSPLFFAHSACVTLRQLCLSLHFDTIFFLNPLTCTPSCLLSSRLVDVLFMFISVCLLFNKALYSFRRCGKTAASNFQHLLCMIAPFFN